MAVTRREVQEISGNQRQLKLEAHGNLQVQPLYTDILIRL
jgi:hypothetical protein